MNQIKKMSGLPPVSPKSSVRFFLKFALNTYLRNKSTLFKLLYKVNFTFPVSIFTKMLYVTSLMKRKCDISTEIEAYM